jgi:ArsR family transcriptional regulator
MHDSTSKSKATSVTKAAAVLRVLADERRLRLLKLLLTKKELCVCEIVDALVLPQYEVSRHLAALRKAGLTADRKDGLWVYYYIPESAMQEPFVADLLKLIREQVVSPRQAAADLVRLEERLALRVGNQCVIGLRS